MEYADMASAMETLAEAQSGYLGIESVRDPATRLGITVSYWTSTDAISAWKAQVDHAVAQQLGRDLLYECYEVRIARVERAYCWHV
jgi:heme-degrading monooxygenase HmoA